MRTLEQKVKEFHQVKRRNQQYPAEIKAAVIDFIQKSNMSAWRVAHEFKIRPNLIYNWLDKVKKDNCRALVPVKIEKFETAKHNAEMILERSNGLKVFIKNLEAGQIIRLIKEL